MTRALQGTWQASAATVYRNWLQYLVSKRANTPRAFDDGSSCARMNS